MYDTEVAEIWDTIYRGRGRDYEAEAAGFAGLIRERRPATGSLLDVACGTGAHLSHFADMFDHVEGLELSAEMIAAGRSRAPWLRMHQGDMRSFDLGRRFDAITCLFSSIGHVPDAAQLNDTLACFAEHLAPGGIVVVEPWWFPETFADGYVTGDVVHADDGRVIGRVSHSTREGFTSRVSAHFTIADARAGLRHFTENLEITLFTRDQYEDAFRRAGGTVEYLDAGPAGRGLFVGVWP